MYYETSTTTQVRPQHHVYFYYDNNKHKTPKLVSRKCKVGEIWRYQSGGFACIVSVTPFDYAPQCEAILCDSEMKVKSKYSDGTLRQIGIMESELKELVGEWTPTFYLKEIFKFIYKHNKGIGI